MLDRKLTKDLLFAEHVCCVVAHLGVDHALCVGLWVTEACDVLALSQSNLLRSAVADEHRLTTPLDGHSLQEHGGGGGAAGKEESATVRGGCCG